MNQFLSAQAFAGLQKFLPSLGEASGTLARRADIDVAWPTDGGPGDRPGEELLQQGPGPPGCRG